MAEEGVAETPLDELAAMRRRAQMGGGERRIEQQHAKGKLTARERLALLFDEDSFVEIGAFAMHRATGFGLQNNRPPGDAVVTGHGTVDGRQVFAYAQDFTVLGGSVSEAVGIKICRVMDMAMKVGAPIIGVNDSGGARIQEGVLSLAAYGDIFLRNTMASGVIPQISVIVGPSAGGAVYSPGITDFVFMVRNVGQMYITGPAVIETVLRETVTHEELGGAEAHSNKSGVAHFALDSEDDCMGQVRRLLSFLPPNNMEDAPPADTFDDPYRADKTLMELVPDEPNRAYDVRDVVERVVDYGDFMEVQEAFAANIVVGFARMASKTVGVVANQPSVLAGVLDIDASTKAARFIRFCDAFNIPLVTFIDVPGFMPGVDQEHGGIIRHGAKLLYAYAEATVPKVSVMIRKAYGGAYIVMSSKHLRGDVNLAWPTVEIAVMGPEGAVNIIHRQAIENAADPERARVEFTEEYKRELANPYVAAGYGFLDDVIDPSETRPRIISALEMLKDKRDTLPSKKHGNIPL